MLRAMLVVTSNHYFYWMYLFLLPSPLPSLLLSFSSSFPLFSVSRPVGDVVLKGYFALRWACGSLSSSYQLFYLHEDKSKALLEHGLSWDPRGNIFFFCVDHPFCLWHCLQNTRWYVSCPPWVREEGTPNIYRAFQKMTQSPLIGQGRKQSSINYCDHIGIGTIWQKHTHKEKNTDWFLHGRGIPDENPGQSDRAITFMFWGRVSFFNWMELTYLGYCGNWMLPTKKEKLIGSCTEVFLFHLKVLFSLW